ncbi:NAD(P)/FAD-dependent oxidoreductase [Coralliovum pocilloporae]|uniref:NAD(P)/FAD-dependent oxidoreductase n=1 Tax=Coralliovum pocilloporae TaxID=3066369 RepID=UPI0033072FB8
MTDFETDILIIGAGMAGAGAAAFLARHADVLLIEREEQPGYHSTGRSAAIYIESYGPDLVRTLNRMSSDFLRNPPFAEIDGTLLKRRGLLYLSRPENEAAFDGFLKATPHLQELSLEEVSKRVPILDISQLSRAAYEPEALDIDVDRLHRGCLHHARNNGAQIRLKTEIISAQKQEQHWFIKTSQGTIKARILVNAAGAWADRVAELSGARPLGLIPMRRTAAILPAPDAMDIADWPLFVEMAEDWYAKPEAGKLLVSPADEDPVPPSDTYPDDMVLAEGLYRFEQAVTIPVSRVERSWAGLRTFAPDRLPVNGFDPDCPGFFWLAGQGGYGIQTAPAMSHIAANLILDRQSDVTPETLNGLAPSRFSR